MIGTSLNKRENRLRIVRTLDPQRDIPKIQIRDFIFGVAVNDDFARL